MQWLWAVAKCPAAGCQGWTTGRYGPATGWAKTTGVYAVCRKIGYLLHLSITRINLATYLQFLIQRVATVFNLTVGFCECIWNREPGAVLALDQNKWLAKYCNDAIQFSTWLVVTQNWLALCSWTYTVVFLAEKIVTCVSENCYVDCKLIYIKS